MNLKPQITTTFTHIILLLLSSSYFFFLLQRTLSPLVNSSLVADPKRPMSHPYFYLCHNLSTQPKLPPHLMTTIISSWRPPVAWHALIKMIPSRLCVNTIQSIWYCIFLPFSRLKVVGGDVNFFYLFIF